MTPAAHSKISIRNRYTSPATLSRETIRPSLTDPVRVSSCLLLRVAAQSIMTELGECTSSFIRIFCGSQSYFLIAQCSDVAWIPTPPSREIPSAPWGAHTGTSQAGISAQTTLSFHKLVFPHKNVSGNG